MTVGSITTLCEADVLGQRMATYTNGDLPLDPAFAQKLSAALQALKDLAHGAQ
jgi:hypothetical protein